MTASSDTALLVINLGTPAAPTTRAVRRYLAEFLGDKRVVNLPGWLWKPLLYGVILPLRGPRSAQYYQKIWQPEGSPLAVYTRRLAVALATRFPQWHVVPAMRYGEPSLRATMKSLRQQGFCRIIALPLYPQYSTTTTAAVEDVLQQEAGHMDMVILEDYADDSGWLNAVASSIQDYWTIHGPAKQLLFSFHGLPQSIANAGDPYPERCEKSARLIAECLVLPDERWSLAYQSRFGRQRWLEPATHTVLMKLAERGQREVDVVCPGFAVDCLETLEEVAIGLAERFAAAGGKLRYIPCLNDTSTHIDVLTRLIERVVPDGKVGG